MVPMSARLRIAVVGLGSISQSVHLPLLARRWDLFDIAALVDLSAERAAGLGRRYGVPTDGQFTSISSLLEAVDSGFALDGVVLATSGSHGGDLLHLAEAGLPVLCEKPVALSTAEVDAVDHALRTRGRDPRTAVLVGYMKEHDPAVIRAREELARTRLRAVIVEVLHPADSAQLSFARLLPPPQDVTPEALAAAQEDTGRALDRAVGSETASTLRALYANVVLGSIVHDISLLRQLSGGIASVDSAVNWGGSPGSIAVSGTVDGGARLHVGWHFLPGYPDYREIVTFHHEHGSVQLTFAVPYVLNAATELVVTAPAEGDGGESRTVYRWSQQEAFENELLAFHAMITTDAVPPSGLAEGRADLVSGQMVLAALAHDEGVALPAGAEAAAHSPQ